MAVRFFFPRFAASLVMVTVASFLAFGLASLLQRRADALSSGAEFAGEQLAGCFVATVAGAGLAAFISGRHRKSAGRDLLATAARPAGVVVGAMWLSAAIPIGIAWIAFLLLTSWRFGPTAPDGEMALLWLISIPASLIGVSFGLVIGLALPVIVSVPIAVATSYVGSFAVAEAGDDRWVQWLSTAFPGRIEPPLAKGWLVGEALWFLGASGCLIACAALLTARPHRLSWRTASLALALSAGGALVLLVNGPSAVAAG